MTAATAAVGGANRSARQVAGGIFANLALPATAFVTGPVLAHALGPEGRGHLAAVIAPITLASAVAVLGLPQAGTYFVANRGVSAASVIRAGTPIALAASAIAIAALFAVAPALLADYPDGVSLMRALAMILPVALFFQLVRGAVVGQRRYGFAYAEQWTFALGRAILIGALALAGVLTVSVAAWASVVPSLAAALILLLPILARRAPETLAPARLGREMLAYGARAWGGVVAGLANKRIDQVVLLPLAGAAQLGYYAVAVSLAELSGVVVNAVQRIVFAEAAARRDWAVVARAARCVTLVVGTSAAIGCLLAPLLVEALFGSSFAPATAMAQILLVAAIPASLASVLGMGLLAAGHPSPQSAAQGVALVVTAIGLAVLVPALGAVGAAWTSLAAYSASLAVTLPWIRRLGGPTPLVCVVPTPADVRWLGARVHGLLRLGAVHS